MKNLGRVLAKIVSGLSYVTGGIAALALVAAAIIITEGVVVRKVFGVSTIWQIEASVYLLMYACFVGAAFAQMHDHHLNVDLVIIPHPCFYPELRPLCDHCVVQLAYVVGSLCARRSVLVPLGTSACSALLLYSLRHVAPVFSVYRVHREQDPTPQEGDLRGRDHPE
jgi:hypothetical protein